MNTVDLASIRTASPNLPRSSSAEDPALRKAFDAFVGETFFGQMLQSMRKTVDKPAYFGGGQMEDAFTQQLDQVMAQKLTAASADKLSGPMFQLFSLERK
jgi:Rod binding domain-containing protein